MAGITLSQAEEQLSLWLAASSKVATGQQYRIGDKWFTRADAREIRENIKFWQNQVMRLSGDSSGITIKKAVPL